LKFLSKKDVFRIGFSMIQLNPGKYAIWLKGNIFKDNFKFIDHSLTT